VDLLPFVMIPAAGLIKDLHLQGRCRPARHTIEKGPSGIGLSLS
jgi:hypothetical protein